MEWVSPSDRKRQVFTHKIKENGAIAGGNLRVEKLREGTLLPPHMVWKEWTDSLRSKQFCVLSVAFQLLPSRKRARTERQIHEVWLLLLTNAQILFIGGQIIWEGKYRLLRTPERPSCFKKMPCFEGFAVKHWGFFSFYFQKIFILKCENTWGLSLFLLARVLFSTLKSFEVLNDQWSWQLCPKYSANIF